MNHSRRRFLKLSGLSSLFLIGIPKALHVNYFSDFLLDDNERLCKEKFSVLIDSGVRDMPLGDAVVEVGKSFLGVDYVGGTLDMDAIDEKLVINLTGLDCVTFVENCLVFARCIKLNRISFGDYRSELSKIRYRDGIIDGYGSRLHYFTDWVHNNQDKGILKDITAEIGGVEYIKEINFMSKHPDSYKQLSDKVNLENIKTAEEAINSRIQYYIPVKSISKVYNFLQNGDIIATTTSIPGLDVTHTGYVYKGEDGGTYFLHASLKSKQVIVSNNQLQDYVREDSKKTGIIVARPLEV